MESCLRFCSDNDFIIMLSCASEMGSSLKTKRLQSAYCVFICRCRSILASMQPFQHISLLVRRPKEPCIDEYICPLYQFIYCSFICSFMCISDHLHSTLGHNNGIIAWLLSVKRSYILIKGNHQKDILIYITVFCQYINYFLISLQIESTGLNNKYDNGS